MPNFEIPEDVPVYRLKEAFFGPDQSLHEEGDIIVLLDPPNEDMEPMNELARKEMEKYLTTLDDLAKETAAKNGRAFNGRPRTLEGAVAVAMADEKRKLGNDTPVMPKPGAASGADRVRALGKEEVVPEIPQQANSIVIKRGPGRPKKVQGGMSIDA